MPEAGTSAPGPGIGLAAGEVGIRAGRGKGTGGPDSARTRGAADRMRGEAPCDRGSRSTARLGMAGRGWLGSAGPVRRLGMGGLAVI